MLLSCRCHGLSGTNGLGLLLGHGSATLTAGALLAWRLFMVLSAVCVLPLWDYWPIRVSAAVRATPVDDLRLHPAATTRLSWRLDVFTHTPH